MPDDSHHTVRRRLSAVRHPCQYFAGREARVELLHYREEHSVDAYSALAPLGFRRLGDQLYRPSCEGCADCVPIRIPVREFRVGRRFRRIMRKNTDVVVRPQGLVVDEARYLLYDRYIRTRHADGSMFPPSLDQFLSLFSDWAETFMLDAYLDDVLVASAVTDVLTDGLAAVYTFFVPDLPRRSLGVFSILQQIAECRRRALPYLYLGYWVVGAPKMAYKVDFQPAEILRGGRWVPLSEHAIAARPIDPETPTKR